MSPVFQGRSVQHAGLSVIRTLGGVCKATEGSNPWALLSPLFGSAMVLAEAFVFSVDRPCFRMVCVVFGAWASSAFVSIASDPKAEHRVAQRSSLAQPGQRGASKFVATMRNQGVVATTCHWLRTVLKNWKETRRNRRSSCQATCTRCWDEAASACLVEDRTREDKRKDRIAL
ncbi:hypothetical protein BD626DRAFT_499490 [Schizophyllum amplum]|uniref:Uncharacterized protein n=1 Tax=Schizophyllum amplum TaxID=97359 RepID=A0A550CBE1_9AGAR|nr:hypothetical protein BD626DRAFT_499490 [Auriculariopsis ampla]